MNPNLDDTPGFPVWDATTLTGMMGDNHPLRRRLLEKYLVMARGQVDTIIHAVAAEDAAMAGSVAHALKSSSRTVGAIQLGELCMALEKAGKSGDRSACKVLTGLLHEKFAAVAEKIKQSLD